MIMTMIESGQCCHGDEGLNLAVTMLKDSLDVSIVKPHSECTLDPKR